MLPKRINTLEEVYAEQQKLKREMRFIRHEMMQSAGYTTGLTKHFLVRKVALPAGGIGLGLLIAKTISGVASRRRHKPRYSEPVHSHSAGGGKWLTLLPIVLSLVQQFFLKKEVDKKVEQETGTYEATGEDTQAAFSGNFNLKMMLPALIAIVQQFVGRTHKADVNAEVQAGGHSETDVASLLSNFGDWLVKLLPVMLPFVQQHFLKNTVEEKVEEKEAVKTDAVIMA